MKSKKKKGNYPKISRGHIEYPKAGPHKDKRKEANKRKCRGKVRPNDDEG